MGGLGRRAHLFALPLLLAATPLAGAEEGGGDPLPDGQSRLEALSALVRRENVPDGEVVAAIEDLRKAYTAVLGGGRPPAAPHGKEEQKFARAVETALLRLVAAPHRDHRAKEDDRHVVRVVAVRALSWARSSVAGTLRGVLEEQVWKSREVDPFPSFHDEAFATLLRLDPDGSWPWLLDRAVNCDNDPASKARNLAALDALRLHEPWPDAEKRIAAVRRLVAIFQAPDAFWNDWYDEIAGVRKAKEKMGKWWYGQFWVDIRDPVIESLRRFATDPLTGVPPVDVDDRTEMFLVRRYIVWQARNRPQPVPPWVDPKPGAALPEFPARAKASALERMYGIPWERWWRENRRLESPGVLTSAGDPFDREGHRTKVLPGLLAPFLEAPDPAVRAAAAVQYGRTGAEGAGARLAALLAPDLPRVVREGAALGLLVLGDPGAKDLLRARATDPAEHSRVRGAAVLALGLLGDRTLVRERFLEEELAVPADLGACAVAALGLAGNRADGSLLASLLVEPGTPDPVRGQVGTALLHVRDPEAIGALQRILAESGKGHERHIAQVAAAVAWAGTVPVDDRRGWVALKSWFARYEDRFGGARGVLAVGLGSSQGPFVRRFLAEEYEACRSDRRRPAEIGFLLLALGLQRHEESTAILREGLGKLVHERDVGACAIALGLAGDRGSAPAILALLVKSERYAVAPSILALGMLGHREAVDPIRRLVERRRESILLENGALSLALLLGPAAFDDLRGIWERCREPELFDGLAEAFRVAASNESVGWLLSRAADATRPAFERAAALSALGRMGQDAEGTVLDRLSRDHNPYTGATTLDGIARHRDLAPLRFAER